MGRIAAGRGEGRCPSLVAGPGNRWACQCTLVVARARACTRASSALHSAAPGSAPWSALHSAAPEATKSTLAALGPASRPWPLPPLARALLLALERALAALEDPRLAHSRRSTSTLSSLPTNPPRTLALGLALATTWRIGAESLRQGTRPCQSWSQSPMQRQSWSSLSLRRVRRLRPTPTRLAGVLSACRPANAGVARG